LQTLLALLGLDKGDIFQTSISKLSDKGLKSKFD